MLPAMACVLIGMNMVACRAPEDFSVDDVARALTAYVLGQFAGATVEAQEPDAAGPGTVYLR